ncbi:protein kinase [Gemmata sp. G18]|uniref:Protein kinase n=1 Tax=Gemmata palustris TaxID=2822762 RepID=A0ABS5BPF6_9BACT|nr:protein kinase [Gemmata palustris]MBP3955541.1 protein kinase [Gemmata palustris]
MPDSTAESFSAVPQDSPPSERGNCDTTVVGTGATFRPAGFRFAPPAAPGEVGVLGAYRLLKQLGKGGMGAVYLALDARLGRKLALKVMLPEAADADARERFLREARAAAQINHDNVVTIYEADERNGVPYIAMQFLQGCPLDEYLRTKGAPPLPHAVRIARETALGLAAAHALGLVHRDIKPANLWLEAPNGRVKVLDFGLAKPIGRDTELTRSGMVVGTPAYMSPEQGRGQNVDARSDLFSLGVVLYRLCTGKTPFAGATAMDVMIALGTKDPVPVRELAPGVPDALAALVHQLLAKEPGARPQSAAEVVQRLRSIGTELTRPRPPAADGSVSQPIVVYPVGSALHITLQPQTFPSAFADLGAQDEPRSGEPIEQRAPRKRAGRRGPMILVGASLFVAALAAGGITAKITNKDAAPVPGAPERAKTEVGGKTVTPEPKRSAPAADADRKAAEYILSLGGAVRVEGEDREITTAAELPPGAVRLTSVFYHGGGQLTDAGVGLLGDCKYLTNLVLHNCNRVTVAGLDNFKGKRNLLYLSLALTPVSDEGLVPFKDCKGLLKINLQGAGVTDAGLALFKDCKDLRSLGLRDCRLFTDAGLVHFQDCTDLEQLDLVATPTTDAGLAHFKGCKNLQGLGLNGTGVTSAGLALIANYKHLTYLELADTQISDAGLTHLAGLDKLKDLKLADTNVTAQGVEAISRALPRCKINWAGGTVDPKPVGGPSPPAK